MQKTDFDEKIEKLARSTKTLFDNIQFLNEYCLSSWEPLRVIKFFLREKEIVTSQEYVDLFVPLYGDFEARAILWGLIDKNKVELTSDRKLKWLAHED